jgi:hypothetical protein
LIKKLLNYIGFDVVRVVPERKKKNINPADYSTTYVPMEVPCQKESYFYALNNFVNEGDRVLDGGRLR